MTKALRQIDRDRAKEEVALSRMIGCVEAIIDEAHQRGARPEKIFETVRATEKRLRTEHMRETSR